MTPCCKGCDAYYAEMVEAMRGPVVSDGQGRWEVKR